MFKTLALAFIFLLTPVAFAEQTGNIIAGNSGIVYFVTGFHGSTVEACNSTLDCIDSVNYKCLVDYDGESVSGSAGWCAPASQTDCAHYLGPLIGHDNTSSGSAYCINDTAYRSCSSGSWSDPVQCGAQNCSAGACSSASSSSSSSSSGSGFSIVGSSNVSSIRMVSYPRSETMYQGDNLTSSVNLTNGNVTLRNVSISVHGAPGAWFTLLPSVVQILYPQSNASFVFLVALPPNASLGNYTVVINASSGNTSDAKSFDLNVLPTNVTIETQYKPTLASYVDQLDGFRQRFDAQRDRYDEVQQKKISNLINFTSARIMDAQSLLDQGRYKEFNDAVLEIQELLGDISTAFQVQPEQGGVDYTFMLVVAASVGISAAVLYFMLRPQKEDGFTSGGWLPGKTKDTFLKKMRKKIKKSRKEESFFDKKDAKK